MLRYDLQKSLEILPPQGELPSWKEKSIFFFFFFSIWTILKAFIEFVRVLLLLIMFCFLTSRHVGS